jgi:hypothetical protein
VEVTKCTDKCFVFLNNSVHPNPVCKHFVYFVITNATDDHSRFVCWQIVAHVRVRSLNDAKWEWKPLLKYPFLFSRRKHWICMCFYSRSSLTRPTMYFPIAHSQENFHFHSFSILYSPSSLWTCDACFIYKFICKFPFLRTWDFALLYINVLVLGDDNYIISLDFMMQTKTQCMSNKR